MTINFLIVNNFKINKMKKINTHDYYLSAKSILPKPLWDYIEGGASDELTIEMNTNDFKKVQVTPRRMIDIKNRNITTSVLGQKIQLPVIIAPVAGQRNFHEEGVLGSTKAAETAGTINVVPTNSGYTLEEVTKNTTQKHWFQIYHYDKKVTKDLILRAQNAGYSAICLTVDGEKTDRRERDQRNNLKLKDYTWGANLINYPGLIQNISLKGQESMATITYNTIKWIREITNLPLIIKGIISPEDAKNLEEIGVNGIIVSNHGGRVTDSIQSSISALPKIKNVVSKDFELYLDSGIRRGMDVIKSISLGAKAVLIGRPMLWGLSTNGQKGVEDILRILREEIDLAMAGCGETQISQINPNLVKYNFD